MRVRERLRFHAPLLALLLDGIFSVAKERYAEGKKNGRRRRRKEKEEEERNLLLSHTRAGTHAQERERGKAIEKEGEGEEKGKKRRKRGESRARRRRLLGDRHCFHRAREASERRTKKIKKGRRENFSLPLIGLHGG